VEIQACDLEDRKQIYVLRDIHINEISQANFMPLRVEERMRLTPIMSDDAHVKRRHELAICCFVGKLYEQAPSRIDSHYLKLRVSGDMIDCRTRLNLVEHHRNLMTYLWNFVSIYIRKGNRSTSDLAVAILNFGMARHDISSDVAL
jgi:hypothetical protein